MDGTVLQMFVSRLFDQIRSYPVDINNALTLFSLHLIPLKSVLRFLNKYIVNKPTFNYQGFNHIGHIEKYNDLSSTQNDIHYINSIGHAPFSTPRIEMY